MMNLLQQPTTGYILNWDSKFSTFFWICCGVLFLGMLWMVPHYGSSGDEIFQYLYGKMVFDYYTTFGHNRDALESEMTTQYMLRNYGGLFDGLAEALSRLIKPHDVFKLRHYLNILFAFPAFVFGGLIAKEITGRWRAAVLGLFVLLLTPRFWGECFNNPKDIPFAMTMLFFTWALIRWLQRIDVPGWRYSWPLALSVMLGISTRPGGILFIMYFLFFALLFLLKRQQKKLWKITCWHILIVCAVGYLGGCLFWPYALENPVLHPYKSLKLMAKYPAWSHLLFEGKFEYIPLLPRYYGIKMLLITLPLFVISGFALTIIAWFRSRNNSPLRTYLPVLLFMVLFPFLFMLIRGSFLYDGVRHLLFIIALISVAAAIGIDQFFVLMDSRKLILHSFLVSITILAFLPLRFMVRNHPYEYTYFNEFIGGLAGAFSYYETDYYMHSVKKAYEWLVENQSIQLKNAPDSTTLTTDCGAQILYNYSKANPAPFRIIYEGFSTQNQSDWDYGIFISRFMDGPALRSGYWPGNGKVIYEVKADGVPLCIVLKNDQFRYGFKAWKAQEKGDFDRSVFWGRKAAKMYPNDLEIWSNLSRAYLAMNKPEDAAIASSKAFSLSSDNNVTVYYAAEIAFRLNNIPEAKRIYQNYLKRYPHSSMAWLGLAQALAMEGDIPRAETSFWRGYLIDTGDQYRIYKVLAAIARKKGFAPQALIYEDMARKTYPY